MTLTLAAFCLVGALFGLATYSRRHLFSEGHTRAGTDAGWVSRLGWAVLCTLLWPLMVLTGAFNALNQRSRQRAASARAARLDTRGR